MLPLNKNVSWEIYAIFSLNFSICISSILLSFINIFPLSALYKCNNNFDNVVFPEPLSPTNATFCPFLIVRLISSNTSCRVPYLKLISLKTMSPDKESGQSFFLSFSPFSASKSNISPNLSAATTAVCICGCKFIKFFTGSKKYTSKELNVINWPIVICPLITHTLPTHKITTPPTSSTNILSEDCKLLTQLKSNILFNNLTNLISVSRFAFLSAL